MLEFHSKEVEIEFRRVYNSEQRDAIGCVSIQEVSAAVLGLCLELESRHFIVALCVVFAALVGHSGAQFNVHDAVPMALWWRQGSSTPGAQPCYAPRDCGHRSHQVGDCGSRFRLAGWPSFLSAPCCWFMPACRPRGT
jgi:hypothetical protein